MSNIVPIDRRYRGYMNFFIEDSKTAVLDVGMCYDAPVSIALLNDLLKGRKLDYIMLTHSHYDHAGALTEYRKAFPEARVIASGKTASVFERDGARRVIKELSDAAAEFYAPGDKSCPAFDPSGLYVDRIVEDGDAVDLGGSVFRVCATPGHTDCSISFFDEKSGDLLLSEATGVYVCPEFTEMTFLKSFSQCMASIDLCDSLGAKRLFVPHYGEFKEGTPHEYFECARRSMAKLKALFLNAAAEGKSDEEILEIFTDYSYRTYIMPKLGQTLDAFLANARPMLKTMKREFPEYFEKRDAV